VRRSEGSAADAALTAAIQALALERWGESAKEKLWTARANGTLAYRDDQAMQLDEGTTRTQPYLRAYSTEQPLVVHTDRSVVSARTSPIYPGCRVNVFIDLWVQETRDAIRVNAALEGVQYVADGKPLVTREASSKDDEAED
jgi:hypothetical protein